MRPRGLVAFAFLALSATCQEAVTNLTSIFLPDYNLTKAQPFAVLPAAGDPAFEQTYWQKCVCRRQKLTKACTSNKDKTIQFGTPLDNNFGSTLEVELSKWGYLERNEGANEKNCDLFEVTLAGVLEGLGLEGHNECFWFQQNRGEKEPLPGVKDQVPVKEQMYKVGEKSYRNTYAKAIMAANTDDGAIFFIDRMSAASGAAKA
ncbi:hypothetical protein E8E11_011821 [Didymella keratinophila]|nr:hypothetical protein E8E11_011821 [Didymella keratinophila]